MSSANDIKQFIDLSETISEINGGIPNRTENPIRFIALVQEVEEHFNIEINDDLLNNIYTVQGLIEEVEKLLK